MLPILDFRQRYGLDMTSPDRFHLNAISAAFSYLPYENVTKILKEAGTGGSFNKLRMPGEVLEDHLRWNSGGTCFSLCNTLVEILKYSGYSAYIGMADMHYGNNIHCAVIVKLPGQEYLLDPGYLLHTPIPLPAAGNQSAITTPMNAILLKHETGAVYSLYTREEAVEKWRYRIRAVPISDEEFQQHWIHSFSLNSMEHVMMTRVGRAGRLYFRKNQLEVVNSESRRKLQIRPDSAHELAEAFGLPADLIADAQRAVSSRPAGKRVQGL